MPNDYLQENIFISLEELKTLAAHVMPREKINDILRIAKGSTNAVYRVNAKEESCVIKIAYRADRIANKILEKESRVLKFLERSDWPVPIPRILWEGKTKNGYPVIIETALAGERVEDIVYGGIDIYNAGFDIGKFVAMLHGYTAQEINEFEVGRKIYTDFPSYARACLETWQPLLEKVDFIPKALIAEAYKIIEERLPIFQEKTFVYLHCDLSQENLLGIVTDSTLALTGVCDFETVQTGPAEYDFATIDNGLFLAYPKWEKPFLAGYESIRPLPSNHDRLVAMHLLRGLRYLKRTVKYKETHYAEQGKNYLEKWLTNAKE